MSHIHLPDGVIPVFWWVLGYALAIAALAFALYETKSTEMRRKVPLLGILAAMMLIGQSVPLGPIPFHLNLAVLAGIVLGPWLGVITVFVANLFLAFLGHGGITVAGLNTVVVGSEAVFGYLLFGVFRRFLPTAFAAAMLATALTLIFSIALMVGVVALSNVSPGFLLEELAEEGAVTAPPQAGVSVVRFLSIIAPFAVVGIIIESFVTGLIVRFLLSVRPDIIEEKA